MEQLDWNKMRQFEKKLGCRFCDDGEYAEMSLTLGSYREQTEPIAGVTYGFYSGSMEELRELVAQVDPTWTRYYREGTPVFCAWLEGEPVSFCIVEPDNECALALPGVRVGSIGCVGTLPQYRGRKIGLRMVDLATVFLQQEGYHKSYICYTGIDHWYAKLGYKTYARFTFD